MAIKQLSLAGIPADNLAGIMGEIDLLKNLNHRNIVKYIGAHASTWDCLRLAGMPTAKTITCCVRLLPEGCTHMPFSHKKAWVQARQLPVTACACMPDGRRQLQDAEPPVHHPGVHGEGQPGGHPAPLQVWCLPGEPGRRVHCAGKRRSTPQPRRRTHEHGSNLVARRRTGLLQPAARAPEDERTMHHGG